MTPMEKCLFRRKVVERLKQKIEDEFVFRMLDIKKIRCWLAYELDYLKHDPEFARFDIKTEIDPRFDINGVSIKIFAKTMRSLETIIWEITMVS